MDALRKLEVGGFVFDVGDGERLTYRHAPREGRPMSEAPVTVQEVVAEWAAPSVWQHDRPDWANGAGTSMIPRRNHGKERLQHLGLFPGLQRRRHHQQRCV